MITEYLRLQNIEQIILLFVNCKAKKYCNKNEIHYIVDELNSHIEKWAL